MLLRAIVRKEFQFHWAGLPLRIGALMTLVLTASSALIAVRDFNLRLHAFNDRTATFARALREKTVYSFLQPVLVRPPEPLSVLEQGFDAQLGSEVTINVFAVPGEAQGGVRDNEFLASPAAADLTAIVAVVLGLLALLLAHEAIEAERAGGAFSALLASGVSRRQLLAGKVAGGLLAIALPLGSALLVSLAILGFQVEAPLTAGRWLRVLGLALAYSAYLSLLFLFGLLVSLSVRGRSRALAASVVVWLTTSVVLPATARTLASDLGSSQGVREAARRAADLLAERDQLFAREIQREPRLTSFSGDTAISFASGENRAVRYRYGSAAYYNALRDYHRSEIATGMRYADRIFAEQKHAQATLLAGERLCAATALISPAVLLASLAQALAGTSIEDSDRFLAACRRYRREMIAYLESRGAFTSWRWFTDDAPESLHPWPRFLGLSPATLGPREARSLFEKFGDPAIESRVRRAQALYEQDPARRLRIEDLPRFAGAGAGWAELLPSAAPQALGLFLLNAAACLAVGARFRRWSPG